MATRVDHFSAFPVLDGNDGVVGVVSEDDRPDAEIRNEIEEGVVKDAFCLDNLALNVTVTGGVVTLAGQIEREPMALSLLQAVRQLDGVVAVREKLSYPRRET
jgi:osmotically-inducible protein OsmY